jgi:hypothetical protein
VVDAVAHQAAAGDAGRPVRLLVADEARVGRGQDPRRCWAPPGGRPRVASQVIRASVSAVAARSPQAGALVSLVRPAARTEAMTRFLADRSRRHPAARILLVVDGAGGQWAKDLVVPATIRLLAQPAHRPALNPVEHLGEALREKWFANTVFTSLGAVEDHLVEALVALEGDPARVASRAGFDWIANIPLNAT